MADQTNDLGKVIPAKPAPATVIEAMHERYEWNDRAYTCAEVAQRGLDRDSDRYTQLQEALQDLTREADSLRIAILRQRIVSNADWAIFTYHLHLLSDMVASSDLGEHDRELVQVLNLACETLFDHTVGENLADMEEVGAAFQRDAMRCHYRRNDRDGIPSELNEMAEGVAA